jgi:excisionase family DNA binding protein
MSPKYISTGQAAKICSVTRDTVLKWIQSGYLPARRTAGGHHRILRSDLDAIVGFPADSEAPAPAEERTISPDIKFCWEHHGDGEVTDECRACAIYAMRAQRCYEVLRLAPDTVQSGIRCQRECSECGYFEMASQGDASVLVVTTDPDLTKNLHAIVDLPGFTLQLADCGYSCSSALNVFRPDYVFVDCSLGLEESKRLVRHLLHDGRVPFVRVVVAGCLDSFPQDCETRIFARIDRQLRLEDIIETVRLESGVALNTSVGTNAPTTH